MSAFPTLPLFAIVKLASGTNYELMARDITSSFDIDASPTQAVIEWSVVHP